MVDKVKQRLANWKGNTLVIVGRNALIKYVAMEIPNYVMQTSLLPKSCCDEIDQSVMKFL